LSLGQYTLHDRFHPSQVDPELPNSKISWTSNLASDSVNERLKKYQHLFDDPQRLPYYDEKGQFWTLSSKFNLEEDEPQVFQHPFLENNL